MALPKVTTFATDHVGVEALPTAHECDGSRIGLFIEATEGVGFMVYVTTVPGMRIQCNRTSNEIEFRWQYAGSNWQDFANSEALFTISSATNVAAITCCDV